MTAQAGAVAYREWRERDIDKDGCHVETRLWELGPGQSLPPKGNGVVLVEPLYAAPPAAVPVEALEGLVAKWRGRGVISRECADELTTLIKERSNG